MRLERVTVSGFRGFREAATISFGPGFAVVTGRNGSGKSSVCDAVEFALTGGIRGTARFHSRGTKGPTEKGESIGEYVWWRGTPTAPERYVELVVLDDEGERFTVRRTPTGATVDYEALCDKLIRKGTSLDEPLSQLCRTSILRDEEITRLSVDLPEVERFDFVRTALGTADFSLADAHSKKISQKLRQALDAASRRYEESRFQVSEMSSRLSESQANALDGPRVADAEALLRSVPEGVGQGGNVSLTERVAQWIADERSSLAVLMDLYGSLQELRSRESALGEHGKGPLQALAAAADAAASQAAAAQAAAQQAATALASLQGVSPTIASLALLAEHGARVGLRDNRCPLCGSEHSKEEFLAAVSTLREAVKRDSSALEQATRVAADASQAAEKAGAAAAQASLAYERARGELGEIKRLREEILARIGGIRAVAGADYSPDSIAGEMRERQDRLSSLEAALAVWRGSRAAAQIADREQALAAAKAALTEAEGQVRRLQRAMWQVEEAGRAAKRLQGELVDEQLGLLSPLLSELYHRLRPHTDWHRIKYQVRGDVKRMLRLDVGEGVNPRFVFSSGQRRALGLAFLLALHLSRSWCVLRTLVLDDPIQHVDDFRSLHLSEVLSAIRRTGRQVICTVEDEALADLLTRRLRSTPTEHGSLITLKYVAGRGARVESARVILPLTTHVLISA